MNKFAFYEFFAGGGMARAGLGDEWQCVFANDFDAMKVAAYRSNWGEDDIHFGDINDVSVNELPGQAQLAWASFPCQDLSLAGNAAGIGTEGAQTRSGAFWAFWRLMQGLLSQARAPQVIVLENVYGSLTTNGGADFALIARSLALGGYRFGAIVLDAAYFLPQSRPRVFIIAFRNDVTVPKYLIAAAPSSLWHPPAMMQAMGRLADVDQQSWLWLNPSEPIVDRPTLASMIEDFPTDVVWHSVGETEKLIAMMSPVNRRKLDAMLAVKTRQVGTIYKRTRVEAGRRMQRAELRTDGMAGCLRTPGGGSSRQIVIVTERGGVRTRLLCGREAASLMGLDQNYILPARYNDAYHLAGDGVAVPVVQFIAREIVEPVLAAHLAQVQLAA
jgi:DNA (cytosine-5)-methyltransferase 1